MKVIFIAKKENIPQYELGRLEKYAQVEFVEEDQVDIRELETLKRPGDKILAPFPEPMDWKFPSEFLAKIPDLKGVCLSTTGYDWIDGEILKELDLPLTNVSGSSTNAVAEGAIFMMMALARKWPLLQKGAQFEYVPSNSLKEIRSKKVGIVGLGSIGSRVAKLTSGLGAEICYWSRRSRNKNYSYLEMEELFRSSEFIFVCVEYNRQTDNLISGELIDSLSSNASLIDVSHRGVVDWEYLAGKVSKGEVYGAASDNADSSIDYDGNVFVMPHVNWYTRETLEEKMRVWVDSIISVIKGEPVNVVN